MEDETDGPCRTVPVDPPVHVETFATHCSLTWTADGLPRFLTAVRDAGAVPADASAVVDARDTAGRERHPLAALDADSGATTYVRLEPAAPWTLSWERRTTPVVSLSGTPPPALCRRLHRDTTDCPGWDDDAVGTLRRLTESVR